MNSNVNLKAHDVVDDDDVLGVFCEPLTTESTQQQRLLSWEEM